MIYNVLDYGIIPDGKTVYTKKIQELIDRCCESGGGVICFPYGEFVTATLRLKSNVSIEICKEAKLLGTLNFYDYAPHEHIEYPLYQDASHSYFDCSLFVGKDCSNISIYGGGTIDMRSVWDEDNVRKMVHRGAKCIALKNCSNVAIRDLHIYNATDLAVYFAGCSEVDVLRVKMRVFIDGISPDGCKNVTISDCDVESGDDGIVLKSSYTLNRLAECDNIVVKNCRVKSCCNAIKFGTETNGGFKNVVIQDCIVVDTRLAGLAIESVDGAKIDNIVVKNIKMMNVSTPLFIYIGNRMRGPQELEIGSISNVTIENFSAEGEYKPYEIMSPNYRDFKAGKTCFAPWWIIGEVEDLEAIEEDCQITSVVSGLQTRWIQNLSLTNVSLELIGGCKIQPPDIVQPDREYPEIFNFGEHLPAKGICFRYVDGLKLKNVRISTIKEDVREDFTFNDVSNLVIEE